MTTVEIETADTNIKYDLTTRSLGSGGNLSGTGYNTTNDFVLYEPTTFPAYYTGNTSTTRSYDIFETITFRFSKQASGGSSILQRKSFGLYEGFYNQSLQRISSINKLSSKMVAIGSSATSFTVSFSDIQLTKYSVLSTQKPVLFLGLTNQIET